MLYRTEYHVTLDVLVLNHSVLRVSLYVFFVIETFYFLPTFLVVCHHLAVGLPETLFGLCVNEFADVCLTHDQVVVEESVVFFFQVGALNPEHTHPVVVAV